MTEGEDADQEAPSTSIITKQEKKTLARKSTLNPNKQSDLEISDSNLVDATATGNAADQNVVEPVQTGSSDLKDQSSSAIKTQSKFSMVDESNNNQEEVITQSKFSMVDESNNN